MMKLLSNLGSAWAVVLNLNVLEALAVHPSPHGPPDRMYTENLQFIFLVPHFWAVP